MGPYLLSGRPDLILEITLQWTNIPFKKETILLLLECYGSQDKFVLNWPPCRVYPKKLLILLFHGYFCSNINCDIICHKKHAHVTWGKMFLLVTSVQVIDRSFLGRRVFLYIITNSLLNYLCYSYHWYYCY